MTSRIEQIQQRLQALDPADLVVTDESHLHKGHPGAKDGRGHFHVRIVSQKFENEPQLKRHRQVYHALGDLMQTDIHALGISALTPSEALLINEENS